jgi:hypothetical protein
MKVHRAELSRADQTDPDGAPLCFAREEFCVEVHDISPGPRWYVRAAIVPSPGTVSTISIQQVCRNDHEHTMILPAGRTCAHKQGRAAIDQKAKKEELE